MTKNNPFSNINLHEQINTLNDFIIYQYDTSHHIRDTQIMIKLTQFFEEQGKLLGNTDYTQESKKVLDYINENFKDAPSYNMLYSTFTQIFFKGLEQKHKWSLVNALDYGFDKNIIKEGLKDFFSFNFLTKPENINASYSLFSLGHLLLTNINNATRNTFLEKNEFKSLFNKEESLDIAQVVFKYHPTFIFSIHNFCAFQNFENKERFLEFFTEVWQRTNNTIEDIQLASSFTPYFNLLANDYSNPEAEVFDKITDFCLKSSDRKYLQELNDLLKKPEEFFYKLNESFSIPVAQTLNLSEHIDEDRQGHRYFFHNHINPEIFTIDKEKKSKQISSLLREIELHQILQEKSILKNTHTKVKI